MAGRVLLRLAFDGSQFRGSQRQPDARTVEGEVLRVLEASGLVADHGARLRSQGRTDRGVSALDFPVALDAAVGVEAVALCLAASADDIVPWAGAAVGPDCDPRREARSRTYTYELERNATWDLAALERAWSGFVGTHDMGAFARTDADRSPLRTVLEASMEFEEHLVRLTVRGESFLWNQVRRMVGASVAVAEHRMTLDDVQAALKGSSLPDHPVAPAEPLMLTAVELPIETTPLSEAARLSRARLRTTRDRLAQRVRRLDALLGDD